MLTLLIKGDLAAAAKAADQRGIRITSISCYYRRSQTTDVLASANDITEAKVRAWFCEDIGPAPFPPGSLLFYSREK